MYHNYRFKVREINYLAVQLRDRVALLYLVSILEYHEVIVIFLGKKRGFSVFFSFDLR